MQGKTTVARHYAQFLTSLDVLPGDGFVETTGSRLANDGIPGAKKSMETVMNAGGGAIFIDEAYQLTSNSGGDRVLDFLLAEMESCIGKIVFILAGYNKPMEKFFEHNPGLTSRVPYRLQFADYMDTELLTMLISIIDKKYKGRMKIEGGIRGLYSRIAIRRLGRGRGKEGFGNARALHNMFAKITERQAKRITRHRKEGLNPDDFLIAKEDMIGPDPSEAIVKSETWKDLQNLTGLKTVKVSRRSGISSISLTRTTKENCERKIPCKCLSIASSWDLQGQEKPLLRSCTARFWRTWVSLATAKVNSPPTLVPY